MINDLALIEKDGEKFIDSRVVANGLGIEHHNLMQTITKYKYNIEQGHGILLFKKEVAKGKGQPQKYILLTKDQLFASGVLSRNSPEAVEFKLKIVKAFSDARKIIKNMCSSPIVPQTYADALRAYANEVEEKEKLSGKLQMAGRKIERLSDSDRIVQDLINREGLISYRDLAGMCGIPEGKFIEILEGIILKQNGDVYANLRRNGDIKPKLEVVHGSAVVVDYFSAKGALNFYKRFIKKNDDIQLDSEKLPEFY